MRKILLGIFGIFVAFVLTLFVKSGAWKPVRIEVVERGPLNVVYKDFVGLYHKIVGTIQEVETWARSAGLDCHLSYGEYLDDPNIVEHDRLRSRGGCILESIPPTIPENFKSAVIPLRKYVIGTFDGSPALGPLKVYGPIEDYMYEKNLTRKEPVIEIYNVQSETKVQTEYLFPVSAGPKGP